MLVTFKAHKASNVYNTLQIFAQLTWAQEYVTHFTETVLINVFLRGNTNVECFKFTFYDTETIFLRAVGVSSPGSLTFQHFFGYVSFHSRTITREPITTSMKFNYFLLALFYVGTRGLIVQVTLYRTETSYLVILKFTRAIGVSSPDPITSYLILSRFT